MDLRRDVVDNAKFAKPCSPRGMVMDPGAIIGGPPASGCHPK